MKYLDGTTLLLIVVGGINWGLVALFEFDLVAWIAGEEFGTTNTISRIIYLLVALSALYWLARTPAYFSSTPTRRGVTADR
ncbi:MAG: DUF378 domain-containing protein [Nocardioides sp.]